MADYYQVKNQNIFNPPANTSLGNATNQFNNVYVENDLVLGNVTVTGETIVTPKVSTITYPGDDTAADPAGGQTITLTGSGFNVGAAVLINNVEVSVVSVVSTTTITFTSPANSTGSYVLYVINTDGGTAIAIPGIQYSGTPTWTTAAGSLGSVYETQNFNSTVTATGDAPITYSVYSGTLPPGATFNSNGTITGTSELLSSPTTYTFTVRATDAELQDTNRTFSLTINPDVVTWVSPANGTSYSTALNQAISNVTLSATSAVGSGITYTANALPTGLSLTGATISGTPTVEANSSSLLTATANTTSSNASITINWVISVANDPYFEYNTLLIPGASTTFVDDASTNNFAVSIFGDTKPNNFNPYSPGYYSNFFQAGSGYTSGNGLSVAANSAFAFGTGDFTVEFWTRPPAFGDGNSTAPTMVAVHNGATDSGWQLFWNGLSIGIRTYYSNVMFWSNDMTPYLNKWSHIAYVRYNGTQKIYVDGVERCSTATVWNWTDNTVGIAQTAQYYTGNISNLRMVKGTALYTGNFTPPIGPLTAISGTSLLTCQSNRFIDNSANNFTITLVNSPTVSSAQPFTPNSSYSTYGSGYFDGTGDSLRLANNTALGMGTGDFTIEFWLYQTAISDYRQILDIADGNSTGRLILWVDGGGTLYNLGQNGNARNSTAGGAIKINTWTHVVLTRASGTTRFYINGTQSGSNYSDSTNYTCTTGTMFIGTNEDGSTYAYQGYLTDFRMVKGTAVYTSSFTPPSAPLTAIANTSLLTLQNNQSVNNNIFLDNSTNNFLVTRAGNTTQGTFSPYGGNWSTYFGGQMISTLSPSSTKFTLTGDFTLEAWVFVTALPGGTWGIFDARANGATPYPWLYSISGSGKITFYEGTERNGATTVTLNTWHHVAWVRNGSVLRGYLNGVLDYYNGSYGTGTIDPGSTAPAIGTKDYGISSAWGTTGYLSNIRVVNGTAVYTTSSTTVGATIFTPPTTPLTPITNTVLLTCADSRFMDDSVNNYSFTPSSSTISTQRFSPFNPSSVTPTSYSGYLDGTGDWLTAPDNDALDLGSGDFTVEGWFYQTGNLSTSSGGTGLVTKWTDASNQRSWQLSIRNAAGTATFYYSTSGSDYPAVTFNSVTLTLNTWTHFALVRSGNTLNLYKNGTLAGTSAFSSTIYNSTSPLAIGAWFGGSAGVPDTAAGNSLFQGYVSNVRLVKGTAVYTGAFTPSITPLTAIANTSLLTCQSATFIDNSTNNFTITAYGNSQPSIQNPFGYASATTQGYSVSTIGGSGYFDGSGDTLNLASTTALLGSGNFTIDFWVNLPVAPTGGAYYTCFAYGSSGSVLRCFVLDSSGTKLGVWIGASNVILVTTSVMVAQWAHIALVRVGTNLTAYINGVNASTYASDSTNYNTGQLYIASQAGASYLAGYISDFRIIVGTAVYTSNFVPPSQPLTAIQNSSVLLNMTGAGIYDAAMTNNMETVGDAKLSTAVSKFGGSSMYFDGSDNLSIPSNTTLMNIDTGDFTIEGWVYHLNSSTYSGYYYGGTNGLVLRRTDANKLEISHDGVASIVVSTASIPSNQWVFVTGTRSGSTVRIFIDGTLAGTATYATSIVGTSVATVGSISNAAGYYMNGYIDDLRITRGYARYTSNFTPPTSAFSLS